MKNKSFTLIELLVVIVIIGILAGVIMISTSFSIDKASIAKLKVFEESVANDLAANMVSRWKLDEIINTNQTPDQWGSNTGVVYGTILESEKNCISGKCFSFNGTNTDYISINDDASTRLSSVTITAWIKRDLTNGSNAKILGKRDSLSNFYFLGLATQTPYLGIGGGSTSETLAANSQLDATSWHFVGMTFNETNKKATIYSDSVSKSQIFIGNIGDLTGQYIFIGSENTQGDAWVVDGNYYKGLIDDIKLFSGALSQAQIKQNYIAGLDSLMSKNLISKQDYNQRIEKLDSK